MTIPSENQLLESFLPTYGYIPEDWNEARQFLIEALKMISNSANVKEIGWYLEEETISGKQFFFGNVQNQYRTIFRKVIDFSPLSSGTTSKPHGLTIDDGFRLINLYGAASLKSTSGTPINQPNIDYDTVNINITSASNYDYAQAVIEYVREE